MLSELGRGAASFLATESTGTVLTPRLMTRIAGHVWGVLFPANGRRSFVYDLFAAAIKTTRPSRTSSERPPF